MRRTASMCCAILAVFLLPLLVGCARNRAGRVEEGYSWPRWGGPDGNWVSKETGWNPEALSGNAPVLWTADIGDGYSNVAIHGNRLYATGLDSAKQTIACLDAATGKVRWKYSKRLLGKTPQSTPTIDGDVVYTLSSDGLLNCFHARNGKVKWSRHLVSDYDVLLPRYGFSGSPVVEGNLLLITCNAYGIALDKETGKVAWKSPIEDPNLACRSMIDAYATPVVYTHGDERYLLFSAGQPIDFLPHPEP